MKHQNKVALVTGAAQGLGLACAERFHSEGAKVLLVDVQADKVKAQAERLGENAAWYAADLSEIDGAMAASIVAKAVSHFGSLDIVMCTAGIIHTADFVDFPEDMFDRIQRIIVKSPFLICQAAARFMIGKGLQGAIINMSQTNT